MIRLAGTAVLLGLLGGALGGGAAAQQVAEGSGGTTPQSADPKAARCFQLADLGDRYLSKRGEGSGGPNMMVMGARMDCQKGRYDQGIAELEKVLRGQRITIPPPP